MARPSTWSKSESCFKKHIRKKTIRYFILIHARRVIFNFYVLLFVFKVYWFKKKKKCFCISFLPVIKMFAFEAVLILYFSFFFLIIIYLMCVLKKNSRVILNFKFNYFDKDFINVNFYFRVLMLVRKAMLNYLKKKKILNSWSATFISRIIVK